MSTNEAGLGLNLESGLKILTPDFAHRINSYAGNFPDKMPAILLTNYKDSHENPYVDYSDYLPEELIAPGPWTEFVKSISLMEKGQLTQGARKATEAAWLVRNAGRNLSVLGRSALIPPPITLGHIRALPETAVDYRFKNLLTPRVSFMVGALQSLES